MKKPQHLSNDWLIRFLDDESPVAEVIAAEEHLDGCRECKQRYSELRGISQQVEDCVGAVSPRYSEGERDELLVLVDTNVRQRSGQPEKFLQRFAWAMALAASLAVCLFLVPSLRHPNTLPANTTLIQQAGSALEVDGETFVPLPYSDPDLPLVAHIVQMQVPVSSLADAGVHFESISTEVSSGSDSVLADVLVGIDGQPLGVHVLSGE